MQSRHLFMVLVTVALIAAILGGLSHSEQPHPGAVSIQSALQNVRDYAAAVRPGAPAYAIDGGRLFVGQPGYWAEVPLPEGVIAGAVALAPAPSNSLVDMVYVGAAGELAVYRSTDRGGHWLRTPLAHESAEGDLAGGVTDLAVDPVQRLVFAATDTARLFRLRDTGDQLQMSAQLLLDEPVLQVVTDLRGRGLVLARTRGHLYRAVDYGLTWVRVETLDSLPTTIAVAGSIDGAEKPIMLVGTVDRGVVQSEDGVTWQPANRGLTPDRAVGVTTDTATDSAIDSASDTATDTVARTYVDALATDPLQPEVVYVATSQLADPTSIQHTPDTVAYSTDGGVNWLPLKSPALPSRVADLLPLSGHRAGVYVLTSTSRAPLAVGNVPPMAAAKPIQPAASQGEEAGSSMWLAWLVAGLAALALIFALVVDLLLPPPLIVHDQALQPERYRSHTRR